MGPHWNELIGFAFLLTVSFPLEAVPATPPEEEPTQTVAPPQGDTTIDVTDLDLDDLLNVQVTSPGKKEQVLGDVPAAVYVIREDDLKRSGATSIAEALRSVPGMEVARTKSSTWAISIRGFNETLSNKLLVMIDGRSVYSPLHSGVFWDVQDTFLEDIERIEVIRGPGGSLWGANAVNGVINIITKRSEDTQGGIVTGGYGTEERGFGGARYGFQPAKDLYVRVYGKYFNRDDTAVGLDPGNRAEDGWYMGRGGFRSDWNAGNDNLLTFMGDFYHGEVKEEFRIPSLTAPTGLETLNDRMDLQGADLILRWERDLAPSSNVSLQLYYDYTWREGALFIDTLHTFDLDFQHRFRFLEFNDVNWGAGYRIYQSEFDGSFVFQTDPENHTDDIVSAFVQDEIAVVPDRLRLTLGSKFEYNDYSGFEAQPSARLSLSAGERHSFWGSISRAVRTPSIIDRDVRVTPVVLPGAPPVAISVFGSDRFRSEALLAYEAGYRVRPLESLSLDLAAFYNQYDDLRSGEFGAPFVEGSPPPTHLVVPVNLANELKGETWGIELASNLQARPWWLIQANYSYLQMHLSQDSAEGRDPEHTVWLRSALDLPWNLSLDTIGRYVSKLKAFDVDAYFEADVRLAWRNRSRRFEVALVGQNLLHDSHPEFQVASQRNEIQRGVYLSLTWRF
jgi:iron complex outermembrane receptor protein